MRNEEHDSHERQRDTHEPDNAPGVRAGHGDVHPSDHRIGNRQGHGGQAADVADSRRRHVPAHGLLAILAQPHGGTVTNPEPSRRTHCANLVM